MISLGESISYPDLLLETHAVWGSVSWPFAERAGFCLVIAAVRRSDGFEYWILDDFESHDVRALVRQCGALDLKYWITWARDSLRGAPRGRWIGDDKHDAANKFIREMNEDFGRDARDRPKFRLYTSQLLELEHLYEFIIPKIKNLANPKRRRLYFNDSQATIYLNDLEKFDLAELKPGDYPALEALGFGLNEFQRYLLSPVDVYGSVADAGVTNLMEA